jgi:predicted 3-demethylubiquinone-9 3-methyltransferase (glyoxalase superfamily)
VDVVTFELLGQEFMAISAGPLFKFNEAISFMVNSDIQEEIDYYWEKLSAVREAEQCNLSILKAVLAVCIFCP